MKLLAIGAFLTVTGTCVAQTVWYNGDYNGFNAFLSTWGTPNGFSNQEAIQYEDFVWNSSDTAKSILGTVLINTSFTQLHWEIRENMEFGNNNVGTVVASGLTTPVLADLGFSGFPGYETYGLQADIGSVALTNGNTYFLGFCAITSGPDFAMGIATTSGDNSIGTPVNNGNAFSLDPSGTFFDDFDFDLSMGISASHVGPVPEPATFAFVGLGALALLRRSKKSR